MKQTPSSSEVSDTFKKSVLLLLALLLSFNVTSAQELKPRNTDFIDSIATHLIKPQFLSENETKYIRIIYLIPADSIEKPEYTLSLENAARHLQIWYYNALALNKTFSLFTPVVEVYKTSHNADWYSTNPNGSEFMTFWNNVLEDGFLFTGGMYNDPDFRWLFYIDANPGCNQCGGCGGSGLVVIGANDLKGLAGYDIDKSCPNVIHSYEPCRYVGGMGHELGHAFGLPHPPICGEDNPTCWDNDLMMYGYTKYPDAYFNKEDKIRLDNSSFITDFDTGGLYFPNSCLDLTDTCNFNTQSEVSILYGDSILLEGRYQKTPGFYYDTLNSIGDCDSLFITHLNIIIPPVDAEDVLICEGEVPVLTVEGENIRWYSNPTVPLADIYDNRDGQTYSTVAIGDQIWMAENLNYYTSSGSWYYDNDSTSYAETYGRLYNWETSHEVCPLGWHLPDDYEWQELIDYLGGNEVAGGKIKETGYDHWDTPNTGASNTSGFTALPAGKKDFEGDFHHIGYYSKFWSASRYSSSWGKTFEARSNSAEIYGGTANGETAFSVRCIQNDIPVVGTGNSYVPDCELSGTYTYYVTQTIFNVESPPDTVILKINKVYLDSTIDNIAICDGDSIFVGNNYYTTTGTYYDTLLIVGGCDSLVVTELTVHPVYETYFTAEICEGESIVHGDELQTTPGTYYDSLLTIHECDSIIITELIVNPSPTVYLGTDTVISTYDTIVLDAGMGYINYLWSDGSNEQTITMFNLSVGDHEYSVWVTNIDNCSSSDTIIIHAVLPNSLSNVLTPFDLEIFPNPTSDFLIIKSNTQIETEFVITLIDNSGKVVFERKIEKFDKNNEVVLDLLKLNNGFYILRINSTDLIQLQKIIKY